MPLQHANSPLYIRYGLKMGIACLLSYGFSYLLGLEYPVWAVVSAIIAMQVNVADSLRAGAMRFTGTALGAGAGVALLLMLPQQAFYLVAAVICVTVVCGYLTRFNNVWSATAIACVVVAFSGAQQLSAGQSDAISLGLLRVAEIAIGVGSAFFISLVLWPVRLMDTLRTDLSLQFAECARLVDALISAFVSGESLPYSLLASIEGNIWNNHERLNNARRHESLIYGYEHRMMSVQVESIDRAAESLRSMLEALNDYDEEKMDPIIGAELRILADAIMATLRHLGSSAPTAPAPDLVRGLTSGVGLVENRLAKARLQGETKNFNLHKVLEVFSFYQAMRQLAESLLVSLERMEKKEALRTGRAMH